MREQRLPPEKLRNGANNKKKNKESNLAFSRLKEGAKRGGAELGIS